MIVFVSMRSWIPSPSSKDSSRHQSRKHSSQFGGSR